MTFEQLWERYTVGNPDWLTGGANLSADILRKVMGQCYDQGYAQGFADGKLSAQMDRERENAAEEKLFSRLGG